ncbi:1077_t:CDS:2, partial [Scutellospora calospora]
MIQDPYTDEDPEYRDTPLVSSVPRPTLETCPPPLQSQQYQRSDQHHQNYQGYNNYNSTPQITSTQPIYTNTSPNEHSNQQLVTPIEIEKQKASFLPCKIPYEEKKLINGLKLVVGPIVEPDYNQFCEAEIVRLLHDKKKALKCIPHEQFTAARGKSNPYEKVGKSIFMNRAACKLACLDALVNFTGIKRYDPVKDLAYGWGITLTGDKNYDLNRFKSDTMVRDCFKPSYGADGTGDIYKEENIRYFANEVMEGTKNEGSDLVTADGGIDVRGHERLQELHLKQLVLCQIITMFMTLQKSKQISTKLVIFMLQSIIDF